MLKGIRIKNFQKHKKKQILFDPKITTIVGKSDAGKSSIIRAIQLVLFNKPSGKRYITQGEEETEVQLKIDDKTITRQRDNGRKNQYVIQLKNGSKKYLKAVGGTLPEDVYNISKIDLHNIQNQHDEPFWVSMSGGNISKELNKLVNLEEMDDAIAKAKTITNAKDAIVKSLARSIEHNKRTIDEIKWIEEAHKQAKKIREAYKAWQLKLDRLYELKVAVTKIKGYEENKQKYSKAILYGIEKENKIGKLRKAWGETLCTKDDLQKLIANIKTKKKRAEEWESLLDDYKSELKELESKVKECPECGTVIEKR